MSAPLPAKTVREWLEELPEPLRSEAFSDNQLTKNGRYLNYIETSLGDALSRAIYWHIASRKDWSTIHYMISCAELDQLQARFHASPL